MPSVTDTVFQALATHLQLPVDEVRRRSADDLDRLGLDSHGLMRVLVEIERTLVLPESLELADAALATPASLAAGVSAVVGRA